MTTTRKRYTAQFKAKVAVEAIRGDRTINEIAGHFGVNPIQVSQWKRAALEALPEAFQEGRPKGDPDDEGEKQALYEEIGRLKVELDWTKKSSTQAGCGDGGWGSKCRLKGSRVAKSVRRARGFGLQRGTRLRCGRSRDDERRQCWPRRGIKLHRLPLYSCERKSRSQPGAAQPSRR